MNIPVDNQGLCAEVAILRCNIHTNIHTNIVYMLSDGCRQGAGCSSILRAHMVLIFCNRCDVGLLSSGYVGSYWPEAAPESGRNVHYRRTTKYCSSLICLLGIRGVFVGCLGTGTIIRVLR